MGLKAYAAGVCAALIALTAFAAVPADAQQKKKRYLSNSSRVVNAKRPRARVTVAPRSFLDAGTEVVPGERKFTDYAFPPNYQMMGSGVVTNVGGRVGWDRSPMSQGPWDIPGLSRW
jgi:hypothetical protein